MSRILTLLLISLFAQPVHAQPVFKHALPMLPPASNISQQGFVRIINLSGTTGTVRIYAIDDTGERFGPVDLSLDATETRHFNSQDLERGNASKGLPASVGDGEGHWRLELHTNLDIKPLAYIRTPDGFVTSMHDVVSQEDGRYHVLFFNPASNRDQRSLLRLVNPSAEDADITITGRDDAGRSETREVRLPLAAGAARMLDSEQLEDAFGNGTGKWHLSIYATEPLWVMNLLQTPTGHLTNLSREAPELTFPETPTPDIPPKPEQLIVFNLTNILLNWYYNFGYNDHALTHIYRHTAADFDSAVEIGTSSSTAYTDRDFQAETRYWYWIRWESSGGSLGPPSDPVSVYREFGPAGSTPPQPKGLRTTVILNDVLLRWDSTFVGGFNPTLTRVYRHTADDFNSAIEIGTSRGISITYWDRNRTSGRYWYWIRWENRAGVLGPPSESATATVR